MPVTRLNVRRPYRKKPLWRVLAVVLVLAAAVELLGPYALLKLSEPKPASKADKGSPDLAYFLDSGYQASRKRFVSGLTVLQAYGAGAAHIAFPIREQEGLFIDVLRADAKRSKENLIVITSGIHGVEGYAGAAMIELFRQEFVPRLDPDTTGVMLVHAVNPWGMEHETRYNEDRVDLNRNFFDSPDAYGQQINPSYTKLKPFFEQQKPLGNAVNHELGFLTGLIGQIVRHGTGTVSEALLLGQYENDRGVYFGGSREEPSTAVMKRLYQDALNSGYAHVVHVDLHTGYGSRGQMSIFSSVKETMSEAEAKQAFQYPYVLVPASKDFYMTSGDNTEFFAELQKRVRPDADLYSTTFEFGTMGTGTWASIQSLRNTLDENRLYRYGSGSDTTAQIVRNRYMEMFYPSDPKWRLKAVQDFRQAMTGVLRYKKVPLKPQ